MYDYLKDFFFLFLPFPLSMLENGKMQNFFRRKCFVNIAQGWRGAKCI